MAVEDPEIALDRVELVDGDLEDMVGDRAVQLLVEVVADARSVGEQVLDRDALVDQRQVVAQQRPCRGRRLERPVLDEAHHGQRGEALRPARDPEPRVAGVRDPQPAMGEAVRLHEYGLVGAVDADDAGEGGPFGDLVDRSRQRGRVP